MAIHKSRFAFPVSGFPFPVVGSVNGKWKIIQVLKAVRYSLPMAPGREKQYSWLRSISFRLHLFIVVTLVLAILLVSYLDSRVSIRMINSEIEQSAKRDASEIAADLARRDAPTDPATIQTWLRKYKDSESYISSIDVYRWTGNEVTPYVTTSSSGSRYYPLNETAAIRDLKTLAITQYQDRARFLKIIVPFIDSEGVRGCVTLIAGFGQSELVTRIHGLIAYFLVPGTAILSIILLHFLFTRLLIRRFDRLIAVMNAAGGGNLGIRAPADQDDEIGVIAQRYNEMMQQIERASSERDHLLEEQKTFNAQLRERVHEATHEVSTANERLRQVNEDLLDTQRRLTQAERAAVFGQMAATFAHEIGSPLSAISTHLELMAEDSTISADTRRRLKLIQDQVSRITGFVEEMLSETRSTLQARSSVQLNQILQQLLLFLEQHLTRCRVRVETHFSPDLPEMEANPQQLQQVFLNLLNNACDAMPDGGTVAIETSGYSDPSGEFVVVSIADTGAGISEEKQEHIFEPFFTTKELHRGTGLGLSIAAKIVRQHQGAIELNSTPGAGTKFTIRFRISGSLKTEDRSQESGFSIASDRTPD
jgi:two-component system, NtrC family, sensor kinase